MKYELIPENGRKSFYGKAIVEVDGTVETLYSYGLRVASKTPFGVFRHCDGGRVSMTTATHIKSFCGMDKKHFLALELSK